MKYVYLTMCNSENYLEGVYILNRSLIKVNSKYPLIVMIPSKNNEKLKTFLNKNDISFLQINLNINVKTKEDYYWEKTFEKLAMFGMEQYDKVIFLDSDMIILQNIDNLFNSPNMSAVVAGKCLRGNEHFTKLNSGLIVFKPDTKVMNNLIAKIPDVVAEKPKCGDQDVIQEYFTEWERDDNLELSQEYNFFFEGINPCYKDKKIKLEELKVIHFVGRLKPWMPEYKKHFKVLCLKQTIKNLLHMKFKGLQYEKKIIKRINGYLNDIKY